MTSKISKLFGMDIYTVGGEYKGKVFDLVLNLEKGRIETITTEPLKAKTKQEAKRIIVEKSIPYRNVRSAKDILVITGTGKSIVPDEEPEAPPARESRATPRHLHIRR